jgi:hypothetical protein
VHRERRNSTPIVTYAIGGSYVLSHALLHSMAQYECVDRVAHLRCSGWSRVDPAACEHAPGHEDVAVGLCAHLLSAATTLDVRCFYIAYVPGDLFGRFCGSATPEHPLLSLHPLKLPRQHVGYWKALGFRDHKFATAIERRSAAAAAGDRFKNGGERVSERVSM